MAARYIMPTPVPRAQCRLPNMLCLGEPAVLFCFGFCLGAGGMFMTVSLPCMITQPYTVRWQSILSRMLPSGPEQHAPSTMSVFSIKTLHLKIHLSHRGSNCS